MQSIKEIMEGSTLADLNDTDISKFTLREDEYIKDNIIYCEKCNAPRTTIIEPFKDIKRIVRCICQCEAAELEKRKQAEEREENLKRIARLQCISLIGDKYRNANFDDNTEISHNPSFKVAYDRCKKYCENYKLVMENGYGMYLHGNPGVGKTHLTACMANYLIKEYRAVLFTNFFEISKAIRNTYNSTSTTNEQDLLRRISNVDFLFIDDLGTESLAKNDGDNFLQDKIFEIINTRYNNNKCTVFSSNNSMRELITERNFAPKTVDRISEMTKGAVIKIEGESYRGKNKTEPLPF